MSGHTSPATGDAAAGLPPLSYIRHITTGEIVLIRRGAAGWEPANTLCSPECLNARLPRPPTEDEIAAMRRGSLMGWDGPGATAAFWHNRRERHW